VSCQWAVLPEHYHGVQELLEVSSEQLWERRPWYIETACTSMHCIASLQYDCPYLHLLDKKNAQRDNCLNTRRDARHVRTIEWTPPA
jgi:hypothetical protein